MSPLFVDGGGGSGEGLDLLGENARLRRVKPVIFRVLLKGDPQPTLKQTALRFTSQFMAQGFFLSICHFKMVDTINHTFSCFFLLFFK